MSDEREAEQLFERLATRFLSDPEVSAGTGFGSSPGLRVGGKIFAMMFRGGLVVKLPKERVDELIASGTGAAFDSGKGRPMREWVTVPARAAREWERLAEEAFRFVGAAARTPRTRP